MVFRSHRSDEALAPKLHAKAPAVTPDPRSSRDGTPQGSIRRSSSVRMPRNTRLPRRLHTPVSSRPPGEDPSSPYAALPSTYNERIEEESDATARDDDFSALPDFDSGSPRTSGSGKTALSSIRDSIRDFWADNASGPGLSRSAGSQRRMSSPLFSSNRTSLKERRPERSVISSNKAPAKEADGPMNKGNIFSKGPGEDSSALAKLSKPKLPRASLKGLFPRASEKDNGNGSNDSGRYEPFWSHPRLSPRNAAGQLRHQQQHAPDKHDSESGEYQTASEGPASGTRLANILQLPDIVPQPSLEGEIRIDLLAREADYIKTASPDSSRLSDISDQARAPSSESPPEDYPETSRATPRARLLARHRSRKMPNRTAQKTFIKDSNREDRRPPPPRNPADPFPARMQTAAPKSKAAEPPGEQPIIARARSVSMRPDMPRSSTDMKRSKSARSTRSSARHGTPAPDAEANEKDSAPDERAATPLWNSICAQLRAPEARARHGVGALDTVGRNGEGGVVADAALREAGDEDGKRDGDGEEGGGDGYGERRLAAAAGGRSGIAAVGATVSSPVLPRRSERRPKSWRNAHRNFFPRWAVGVPQDWVVGYILAVEGGRSWG
ncbi:MAG: hypothetical protein LQ340_001109 [Diploschistes diacapsis]|nr:MAG: hypothetical protein LQ340_001109 [Diploschistes diacapsis]